MREKERETDCIQKSMARNTKKNLHLHLYSSHLLVPLPASTLTLTQTDPVETLSYSLRRSSLQRPLSPATTAATTRLLLLPPTIPLSPPPLRS
jgi:hypothetical protein